MECAAAPPCEPPVAPGPLPDLYLGRWTAWREERFDRRVTLLALRDALDVRYMIGVKIAKILRRETFNLYRSMRAKGIELVRLSSVDTQEIVALGAVRRGTHSVTIVKDEAASQFIEAELAAERQRKRRRPSDFDTDEAPRPAADCAVLESTCNESDSERDIEVCPPPWRILIAMARSSRRLPLVQV